MYKPDTHDTLGVINVLREINCLPRWSNHVQSGYTESQKLALNCQIAAIMFGIIGHETGKTLDYSLLPKIALFRAFEKHVKCDLLDETYSTLLEEKETKILFDSYIKSQIKETTSNEFLDHISGFEDTEELKIYKASTAIATFIEAFEIKPFVSTEKYKEIMRRQYARLEKYSTYPVVREILLRSTTKNSEILELFKDFSLLKNRIRWVKKAPLVPYSVLGHSFDVAVLNYLLTLNQYPANSNLPEKGFLVGLFHDIAENWTGDMPSTTKDDVPGLREKTEELEKKVLKNIVFPKLPEWFVPIFETWQLELLEEEDKKLFKPGDNLSAVIESSTQIIAGSRNSYFKKVIIKTIAFDNKKSKLLTTLLNALRKESKISNTAILSLKTFDFIEKKLVTEQKNNFLKNLFKIK